MARDVENRNEISVLFEKFNDLNTRSDHHKMIMPKSFDLVFAMPWNIDRKSAKGDLRALGSGLLC
jgi:hypothetical protein